MYRLEYNYIQSCIGETQYSGISIRDDGMVYVIKRVEESIRWGTGIGFKFNKSGIPETVVGIGDGKGCGGVTTHIDHQGVVYAGDAGGDRGVFNRQEHECPGFGGVCTEA